MSGPSKHPLGGALTLLSSLVVAVVAGRAQAYPDGIFDHARIGCTPCHGGLLDNTTTQLVIDGLPDGRLGRPAGYTPGMTYTITVWVLGVPLPTGGLVALNLRGFNLEATAGTLAAIDETAQAANYTECQLRNQSYASCDPATTCGVQGPDLCRDAGECYDRRCTTPGTGACRLCRDTIVYVQATHTNSGGPAANSPAAEFADGNNLLMWQLRWTAPGRASGDVQFYLAGNVVNGNGGNDVGDVWSALKTPVVVHPAPPS